MSYVYNGNGQWEYRPSPTPTTGSSNSSSNSSSSGSGNSSPTITNNSNKETTESSNTATSEFIDIEQNVLVGDLVVVPDPSYRAKHTVLLQYLGKNLTGLYFVDQVVHSFGSDGYTQSMSVSRNGFGDTIKSGNAGKPVENVAPTQGGLMNGTGDSSRPAESSPPKVDPPKPDKETINRWGTVIAPSGLNVRSGPSISYTKVTSAMPYKTRVFCKFKKDGWYEMEAGSKKGWSSGEWIRLD